MFDMKKQLHRYVPVQLRDNDGAHADSNPVFMLY